MPSSDDSNTKLKRSILLGVLLSLCIVGWHLYEYLVNGGGSDDHETPTEHDIIALTRKLFADEVKHNAYLDQIDFQGKTRPGNGDDRAPNPLLHVHSEDLALDRSSTISLMKRLFDNYELDTHVAEQVTAEEEQEESEFLRAIMATAIMKRTMRFLQAKGAVGGDSDDQLKLLRDIWFTQYSRGKGRPGSSGFEHVFLAELKDNTVLGLHNWVYFSEQERLGHLDYKGYIERVDLGKDDQHLLAVRFTFHHIAKHYNTLLVGTSPELEMSLYTVCFVLSAGQPCAVELGATRFNIITHVWDWRGKKMIASAYPSID